MVLGSRWSVNETISILRASANHTLHRPIDQVKLGQEN
jgi:hypothetical protein